MEKLLSETVISEKNWREWFPLASNLVYISWNNIFH